MKIIFMGTPDFAAGALKAIAEAGHQVTAVVTQPDRQKGRGKEIAYPPVKEYALAQGIPVLQPVRIKAPEAVAELKKYEADVYVVAAFGQILSKQILTIPRFGCINIHASLLPKYRGAAPIPWAILNGDAETGVTIMQMDEGMDTGDMLLKREIPIEENDTADSLHDKLMHLGAELITEALPRLEAGELIPEKQREEEATHVGKLDKNFGYIIWQESAELLARKVRGLHSWPGAYTFFKGKRLKIRDAAALQENTGQSCGRVCRVDKEAFYVQTGEGILRVTGVQIEGKRAMSVREFLLGYAVQQGEFLGKEAV